MKQRKLEQPCGETSNLFQIMAHLQPLGDLITHSTWQGFNDLSRNAHTSAVQSDSGNGRVTESRLAAHQNSTSNKIIWGFSQVVKEKTTRFSLSEPDEEHTQFSSSACKNFQIN